MERFEDLPVPTGLEPAPGPALRTVLDPATRLVTYAHAVHLATEEAPRAEPGATHLLAYRDREGLFRVMALTPAAAAVLVASSERPLGQACASLGLPDPTESLGLLEELRKAGAVAGFQGNLAPA